MLLHSVFHIITQDRTPGTGPPGQDSRTGHPRQDRIARTWKTGQESQDKTPGTGHLGQHIQDRTPGNEQPGKDTQERLPETKKTLKGRAEHANLFKIYPSCFTGLIPTKILIHSGIFQPPLNKTPHKKLKKLQITIWKGGLWFRSILLPKKFKDRLTKFAVEG